MKDYLDSKKKGKISQPLQEEKQLEITEIERNFAKFFPKDLLEAID